MTLTVELVAHGRPAAAALAAHLAAVRGDDPLAPATVVVPRSWVGLSLRRLLASGAVGATGPGAGLANVSFPTLGRLAADLAGPRLAAAGTAPLTEAVLGGAVRAALRSRPGVLAPVGDHAATEQAVADAWRTLRSASADSSRRLAGRGRRQADLVRLVAEVSRRLVGYHDDHDVLVAATAAVVAGEAPVHGPVVVHLPAELRAADRALVAAIAGRSPVHVVLGLTGDAELDESTRALAATLGPARSPDVAEPRATRVVSCPSADAEVLVALRDLSARVAAGLPLHRVGIAYPTAEPWARTVADACGRAEIPVVARSTRTLAQTVPGRALLTALSLPDEGWSPTVLARLVATAPVRFEGREVRRADVDRAAREAGVVGGRDQWSERLGRLASEKLVERDGARAGGDQAAVDRATRAIERSERVGRFVDALSERLTPPEAPSWRDRARWARAVLRFLTGGEASRDGWPSDEREALNSIHDELAELGRLDPIDPSPDGPRFRRTLEAVLERPAPQTARFGAGVLLGPLSTMAGIDLDVLFVLGAVDGSLPPPVPDDAVLPDEDRRAGGDDIPLLVARAADHRRAWLTALAAAPVRVVSFSRADSRTVRALRPARWVLDSLGDLAARSAGVSQVPTLFSRDLPTLGPVDGFQVVPSHLAAVRTEGEPLGPTDLDLSMLVRAIDRGAPLEGHWLGSAHADLGRGWHMRRSRRLGVYDEFEGRVRLGDIGSTLTRRVQSATTVEKYGTCPRRYFLRTVLGLRAHEQPVDILEPEPITKGTMVHTVLERFFRLQTELPPEDRRRPRQPWGADDHATLDKIADEVFDECERDGLAGRRVLWEATTRRLRRDLHAMLRADDAHRASNGAVTEAVELRFGDAGREPFTVDLGDGRRLEFRGAIDRVDRTVDGRTMVFDYKTGSADAYRGIGADPVRRGQILQLPLYGLAAGLHTGDEEVQAAYWFANGKDRYSTRGFELDEVNRARFRRVLGTLASGIERGDFPAHPVDGGAPPSRNSLCRYCDEKPACPVTREATWVGVRAAPELSDLVEVIDVAWKREGEA